MIIVYYYVYYLRFMIYKCDILQMDKMKIVHQLIETSNLDNSSDERNNAIEELNSNRKLTTRFCIRLYSYAMSNRAMMYHWKVSYLILSKFDWTHSVRTGAH